MSIKTLYHVWDAESETFEDVEGVDYHQIESMSAPEYVAERWVEERHDPNCDYPSLDGAPSAPSSGCPTLEASSCNDRTTESCPPSPSGTTCRLSTGNPGLDLWMSSLAASRARISPQPERVQESTANAPGCGPTWRESLAKYAPASRSWKTAQYSLLEGLDEFSETWPRWGMMRSGECWELSTLVHRTDGIESGLWPTIRAQDGERGGRGDLIQAVRGNENTHFRNRQLWPSHRTRGLLGGSGSREMMRSMVDGGLIEEAEAVQMLGVKLWQTLVADDAVNRRNGKMNTPTASATRCPDP